MKFRFRKLNSAGVAHHLGLVLVVVVLVASFGVYRIMQSNAATREVASTQEINKITVKKANGCKPGYVKRDGKCRLYNKVENIKADCTQFHLQYDRDKQMCKDACVAGYFAKDGKCVPNDAKVISQVECADAHRQWKDGKCSTSCQKGFWNNDGKCVRVQQDPPEDDGNTTGGGHGCAKGYYFSDGECVPLKDTDENKLSLEQQKRNCDAAHRQWDAKSNQCKLNCQKGWTLQDKQLPCVHVGNQQDPFDDCPNNYAAVGDQCLPAEDVGTGADGTGSPDGLPQNGDGPACPEGQTYIEGSCVDAPEEGTSSQPVDASENTSNAFRIVVFEDVNFKGKKQAFTSDQPELPNGWNDKISSYRILKGRWQICEDANFQTNCTRSWASDSDLTKSVRGKEQKRNDTISSLRPVVTSTFEDAAADVIPTCQNESGETREATADNTCPEGYPLTCPGGFVLQAGECKEEVVKQNVIVPVDKSFKGKDGEFRCELLGREWIGKVKGKELNGGNYGCSERTCRLHRDGAPRQFKNGPVCISNRYDKPYAEKMNAKKCENLHRIYIKQVKRCAMVPNRKDKDQTIVKAEQCEKSHSTYFIYKAKDKEDECFKPSFFDRVEGVVKTVGGWMGTALQQGPRGWWNVAKGGNYHWADGKCKIDRKTCWNGKSIPVTGNCPAQPQPSSNGTGDGQSPGTGGEDEVTNPNNNIDNNDGINDCPTIRQCDNYTGGNSGPQKCTDGRVRVDGGCWRLLDATSDPMGCAAISAYSFYKNGRCYGY